MSASKFSTSIIIPALNEEKSISAAIDRTLLAFDDFDIQGEVIVINDGSSDATPRLVNEKIKSDSRIRMINHDTPQGIGASFWDGVDASKGDIATMIPGDNENDPSETLRYINLMEHVDIVIPFAYNKNTRSLLRNVLSFVYRFIINTTFMTSFNYTNSTVIYRKSLLKQLRYRSHSFFFQTDILIRTTKTGYLFSEVPYRLGLRKSGKSKAVSFSSLLQIIKGYLNLVKDIYLKKDVRLRRYKFTSNSVSATRQKYKLS